MKTRIIKRHYCDHCHKGMFQRPAMERHEASCFQNPNRKCPVCYDAPEHNPVYPFKSYTESGVSEVSARPNECPACLSCAVNRIRMGGNYDVVYQRHQYVEDRAEFRRLMQNKLAPDTGASTL